MYCSSYCNCNLSRHCAALLSTVHAGGLPTVGDSQCVFRHNNPQYSFSSSFRVMCNVQGQLLFCLLMASFQNTTHPWIDVLWNALNRNVVIAKVLMLKTWCICHLITKGVQFNGCCLILEWKSFVLSVIFNVLDRDKCSLLCYDFRLCCSVFKLFIMNLLCDGFSTTCCLWWALRDISCVSQTCFVAADYFVSWLFITEQSNSK